jgi:hypothetical protein
MSSVFELILILCFCQIISSFFTLEYHSYPRCARINWTRTFSRASCRTKQLGPRLGPFSTRAFVRRHDWARNALVRTIFRLPDWARDALTRVICPCRMSDSYRVVLTRDLKIENVFLSKLCYVICIQFPSRVIFIAKSRLASELRKRVRVMWIPSERLSC